MATRLVFNSIVTPIIATSDSTDTGGNTYTSDVLDENAGKVFGGSYSSRTYDPACLASWNSVSVAQTSAVAALSTDTWNKGSTAPTGTKPTSAYVIAVEHYGDLGSPGSVTVRINSKSYATLAIGESVVYPIASGEALSGVYIYATVYSAGVTEAYVNILVAGI